MANDGCMAVADPRGVAASMPMTARPSAMRKAKNGNGKEPNSPDQEQKLIHLKSSLRQVARAGCVLFAIGHARTLHISKIVDHFRNCFTRTNRALMNGECVGFPPFGHPQGMRDLLPPLGRQYPGDSRMLEMLRESAGKGLDSRTKDARIIE